MRKGMNPVSAVAALGLAVLPAVSAAQVGPVTRPAAPAQPAPPARPAADAPAAIASATSGTAKGVAIRIGPKLILVTLSAPRDAQVVVAAPTVAAAVPAGRKDQTPAPAAPSVQASVTASDKSHAISLAEAPALELDRIGLPVYRMASAVPPFATPLRLAHGMNASPTTAPPPETTLEGGRNLLLLPRDAIRLSGPIPAGGAIALDGCGDVAGVVPGDGETTLLVPAGAIEAVAASADLSATRAEEACETSGDDGIALVEARYRREAEMARAEALRRADAIARLGSGDGPRVQRLMAEKAKFEVAAADAEAAARDLAEHRDSHALDRLVRGGLLGLVLVLSLGGGWWLVQRRRVLAGVETQAAAADVRVSQLRREAAAVPWRNVVLSGQGGTLKISAASLSDGGQGAVIGRNPARADVPFGPADVSQRHARLFVREGQLHIEDLGSTNGSFANGVRLVPGRAVALGNGDSIRLASHGFEVRIGG